MSPLRFPEWKRGPNRLFDEGNEQNDERILVALFLKY